MFNNYFKIAWRNLVKNKLYGIINIGGLAIGMAVSFMLLLYVYNEFGFDKFHANSNRIYQVFKNQQTNGEIRTKPLTQEPLAAALKKDFPEIEQVARTNDPTDLLVNYNNQGLKLKTMAADRALLDIFSFDFIYGNKPGALSDPLSVVLTQSAAKAVFGNINPVGQVIKMDNQFPLKVSAVIKDHTTNSSFSFSALISWQTFVLQQPYIKDYGWDNYSFFTYVLLKPATSIAALNPKLKKCFTEIQPFGEKDQFVSVSFCTTAFIRRF